jgi:hypothetical protein
MCFLLLLNETMAQGQDLAPAAPVPVEPIPVELVIGHNRFRSPVCDEQESFLPPAGSSS